MKWVLTGLYACSWVLLMKASYDAGAEVQSGALGWMSLLQKSNRIIPICQNGPVCHYSSTNLPVIRADTVDRSRLDPRSVGVVHHSNGLLRVGPKVQGTAISGPFGAEFEHYRTQTRICCRVLGHKQRLTVSSSLI